MDEYNRTREMFLGLGAVDRMNLIDELLASCDDVEVRILGHVIGDEAKENLKRAESFRKIGATAADWHNAKRIGGVDVSEKPVA